MYWRNVKNKHWTQYTEHKMVKKVCQALCWGFSRERKLYFEVFLGWSLARCLLRDVNWKGSLSFDKTAKRSMQYLRGDSWEGYSTEYSILRGDSWEVYTNRWQLWGILYTKRWQLRGVYCTKRWQLWRVQYTERCILRSCEVFFIVRGDSYGEYTLYSAKRWQLWGVQYTEKGQLRGVYWFVTAVRCALYYCKRWQLWGVNWKVGWSLISLAGSNRAKLSGGGWSDTEHGSWRYCWCCQRDQLLQVGYHHK